MGLISFGLTLRVTLICVRASSRKQGKGIGRFAKLTFRSASHGRNLSATSSPAPSAAILPFVQRTLVGTTDLVDLSCFWGRSLNSVCVRQQPDTPALLQRQLHSIKTERLCHEAWPHAQPGELR